MFFKENVIQFLETRDTGTLASVLEAMRIRAEEESRIRSRMPEEIPVEVEVLADLDPFTGLDVPDTLRVYPIEGTYYVPNPNPAFDPCWLRDQRGGKEIDVEAELRRMGYTPAHGRVWRRPEYRQLQAEAEASARLRRLGQNRAGPGRGPRRDKSGNERGEM